MTTVARSDILWTVQASDGTRSVALRLTRRLVSEEAMAAALQEFLSCSRHYVFGIRRSRFKYGRKRESEIIISSDSNKPLSRDGIDPRLRDARCSNVMLTVQDGGTATIHLCRRTIHVVANSPDLGQAIIAIGERLKSGARSRFFSMGSALAFFVSPVVVLLALAQIELAVNPRAHGHHPIYDHWFQSAGNVIEFTWLICEMIGIGIMLPILISGPLGIWPNGLTVETAHSVAYRVRVSIRNAFRYHSMTITTGVIVTVLSGLIISFITHL